GAVGSRQPRPRARPPVGRAVARALRGRRHRLRPHASSADRTFRRAARGQPRRGGPPAIRSEAQRRAVDPPSRPRRASKRLALAEDLPPNYQLPTPNAQVDQLWNWELEVGN